MKSLNEKLSAIRDTLLTVIDGEGNSVPVFHYFRSTNITKGYIVWMEDGEDASFAAENRKAEQQIHGTIDYYTQTEFDPVTDSVQNALDGAQIGFRLNSVQYEDSTKLIHYEWEFWTV